LQCGFGVQEVHLSKALPTLTLPIGENDYEKNWKNIVFVGMHYASLL
jgi:hypothetical protein